MTNKELKEKVIHALRERGALPTPRWHFLLKHYIVWLFAVLSLIIGSLAFAVVLYMTINNDWDLYEHLHNSFAGFVFASLPYFWILIVSLFIIVADYNLKHTEKGYKLALHFVVLGSVLGSVIFGTVFYNVGVGQAIDDIFVENIPYYERMMGTRHNRWSDLEHGRIGGLIIVTSDNEVTIQDMRGTEWTILLLENTYIHGDITVGNFVKVIGELHNDKIEAIKIYESNKGPGLRPFPGGHPNLSPHLLNMLHERKFNDTRSMM